MDINRDFLRKLLWYEKIIIKEQKNKNSEAPLAPKINNIKEQRTTSLNEAPTINNATAARYPKAFGFSPAIYNKKIQTKERYARYRNILSNTYRSITTITITTNADSDNREIEKNLYSEKNS